MTNENSIEFDFSKLTLGDVAPVFRHGNMPGDWLEFADKVVVGGVKHMPVTTFYLVLDCVFRNFIAWMAEVRSRDATAFDRMFDGIQGL